MREVGPGIGMLVAYATLVKQGSHGTVTDQNLLLQLFSKIFEIQG